MAISPSLGVHAAMPAVRWSARGLSGLILLFWGFMLIAHLFGNEGGATRPLVWQDTAILATLVLSLAGLAVAWKWELPGGVLALAAISICAFLNWRVLAFPGTLIPITAMLFLTCGWLSSTARKV